AGRRRAADGGGRHRVRAGQEPGPGGGPGRGGTGVAGGPGSGRTPGRAGGPAMTRRAATAALVAALLLPLAARAQEAGAAPQESAAERFNRLPEAEKQALRERLRE